MVAARPVRPILISIMQYHDQLAARTMAVSDVIRAAKRLGADGVELRPSYWTDRERDIPAAQQLLADLNLLVTYATFATLFNDEASGADALMRDLEDARLLGATQLRIFQGPAPTEADDPSWHAATAAVRAAESLGMTLALENFGAAPGNSSADIRAVLDRLDTPTMATNIDIGNYARTGEDVLEAIERLGDRAVSTHLKDQSLSPDDPTSTYLGGGELPLGAILDRLDRLPQPLLHCFEFPGGDEPDRRIAQSLAFLRGRTAH